MKKIYVLDTSVYLTSSKAIYSYGNNDIVVPLKVLEEIDKHKKRTDSTGQAARQTIRIFDDLRDKGSLYKGVRIDKGYGLVSVKSFEKTNAIPEDFDLSVPDNKIIGVALNVKAENPKRKVIVVSRDIHMRVMCDAVGLQTEGYDAEQVVKDSSELYSGFKELLVDDEFVDQVYAGSDEGVFLDDEVADGLLPNQFLMLVSSSSEKKTCLVRYIAENLPLEVVRQQKKPVFGVSTRNKEQTFAMDLLLDEEVPIVTLVGKAGSGKTLCAIAAGLHQVMETGTYKKLMVSRPVQPLGKDIGYLPGTMEEKMMPWLAPIQDNLQNLFGGDKDMMREMMTNGTIEIEALTYIRGRSIDNAFMIIDEAQNLSAHELKTIVTRVGENTKIVFTGDIEQIDNVYVNDTSNGLAYAVEKFKTSDLAGHISLRKGERSPVASLAAKIL